MLVAGVAIRFRHTENEACDLVLCVSRKIDTHKHTHVYRFLYHYLVKVLSQFLCTQNSSRAKQFEKMYSILTLSDTATAERQRREEERKMRTRSERIHYL